MSLLSVQNLTITKARPDSWPRYRAVPEKLIDQVSFDLAEKQCLGLVGEQHSGKMPLTLALLRLHPVSSGSIKYRGQNILALSERKFRKYRREIQVIFPETFSALNPRHTIRKLLNEPLSVHFDNLNRSEKIHRIDHSLQSVNLPPELRTAYPDELDPGQRVRVALARALVVEPRLLICHDVVAGMDTPAQAQILNLLLDLRDKLNLTLLFVTHDLAVADHMSDHILIFHRGSIVETGSPEEIVRHPKHNYTRKLVSSTSTM